MPKLNNRSRKFFKLNKTRSKTNLSKKNPRAHRKVYLKTNSILHTLYGGSGNNPQLHEETQKELDENFKVYNKHYKFMIDLYEQRIKNEKIKFDKTFKSKNSNSGNQNINTILKLHDQKFQETPEYKRNSNFIEDLKAEQTQNYNEYIKKSKDLKVIEEGRVSSLKFLEYQSAHHAQQQEENRLRARQYEADRLRRQQQDAERQQQEEERLRQQEAERQQQEAERQQQEAERQQQQPRTTTVFNANTGQQVNSKKK